MPGTKLKVFCNILKMLCHPICNWLYISGMDVSPESMDVSPESMDVGPESMV